MNRVTDVKLQLFVASCSGQRIAFNRVEELIHVHVREELLQVDRNRFRPGRLWVSQPGNCLRTVVCEFVRDFQFHVLSTSWGKLISRREGLLPFRSSLKARSSGSGHSFAAARGEGFYPSLRFKLGGLQNQSNQYRR